MLKNIAIGAALSAGLATAALAEVTADPIPIDHFARVPNIASVSLSAEGDTLVAIIASPGSENETTAFATWDLDEGGGPIITPSGDRMQFTAASALKADRVIVLGRQEWTGRLGGCGEGRTTGATETHIRKLYLSDVEHSDFEPAFEDRGRQLGVSEATLRCFEIAGTAGLVNVLPLDPEHVIIQQLNQSTQQANFYRYNLRTDRQELLFREGGDTSVGILDPRDGDVLTRTKITPEDGDYRLETLILNPETGAFDVHEPLTQMLSQRYTHGLSAYDEASGQYYLISDKFSDKAAVYWYDPVTRQISDEPILAHPEFEVSRVILGNQPHNFNQLLGFTYLALSPTVYWLDPEIRGIQEGLNAAFPDTRVSIMEYSDNYERVLFSTGSGQDPATYYILHDRSRVQLIGDSRPWIEEENVGDQRWVTYTARDGMEIPAILDLPAGWEEGDAPVPAIIHPHGGPWARDFGGWDFSGWVPFFTSRGYAVLRPQYRGSTGVGRELWLAGDAQWGLAMQDDKDDGAAWLVEQGIADPDRLAIMGYSYGGFAAMAAVVRENSPYQCAIAGAGVSNLARLGNNWSDNRLQRILQGSTVTGMDPMQNTDKANIPVLIFTGDRDVRVPPFHSVDFYNAVRDEVYAEYLELDGMGHQGDLWYPDHTRISFAAMEEFLNTHCGPGGL